MADDVMPLFARSCALSSSCHQGDAGEGIEDLGLGPNNENSPAPDTVLQGIRDQLVSQAPLRSPLPFVEPGDPNGSWLMAKITYASTDLPICSECSDNCGENMPQDDDNPDNGLTPGEREVIAAWILDGAENN